MMKPPGFTFAVGIVIAILFAANSFIRVAGPDDIRSTGIIFDFLQNHGVVLSVLWLIGATIVIQLCFWLYGFFRGFRIPGVIGFWKIVTRNPDVAYDWFLNSDAWETRDFPLPSDFRRQFPDEHWAGPFDLYVPSIEKRICIFGKVGQYEKSRDEFIKMHST